MIGSCICVLALIAFAALMIFGPDEIVWRCELHQGNDAIQRIESYRGKHHRSPGSLEETGLRDSDPSWIFYQKCNDRQYVVWFGTTLGESMTYTSWTRNWESLNRTCKGAE
ncbi:MAG TPA: hypothetical protein VFA04_20820 [Bryobacteraceae bacterium]|nr:hypothetical protein [Bryobacteraceae bacterium]